MTDAGINIGISGWSYYDWKGIFYPEKLKSADLLAYYSEHFSTTEINSSFYHLPRKASVKAWLNNTPENFIFCPKMNKQVTHILRLKNTGKILDNFFEVFEPLKNKIGEVLVQLPPSLKFDISVANDFYGELSRYSEYKFSVEARHDSWLNNQSLQSMKENNISFVISQSGVGFPYSEHVTAKDIYIRFHGPEKLYVSDYSDELLKSYANLICSLYRKKHTLWIYFNNCYFGNAIKNAYTLQKMINNILESN